MEMALEDLVGASGASDLIKSFAPGRERSEEWLMLENSADEDTRKAEGGFDLQESFESTTDEGSESYTHRPFIRTFSFLLNLIPSGAVRFLAGLPTVGMFPGPKKSTQYRTSIIPSDQQLDFIFCTKEVKPNLF